MQDSEMKNFYIAFKSQTRTTAASSNDLHKKDYPIKDNDVGSALTLLLSAESLRRRKYEITICHGMTLYVSVLHLVLEVLNCVFPRIYVLSFPSIG